ncbi:MAG: helix-turn-helix domain-containing protein [Oscillospiraceae bacterium]|nr:helix-turn-helix domain-containing protein [Oscillospiraceae bacterium]
MLNNIEDLKLIDIVQGESVARGVFKDRFSHAFVCKLSGSSTYHFEGRALELKAGELLYIPKGSSYTVMRSSQEESCYVLMNFDAVVPEAVPRNYDLEGFGDVRLLHGELARLWLLGDRAERYKCISVFYNVLSFLTKKENVGYAETKRSGLIRPAVEHLHANLFDCSLRVGELHRLCGVSDTYFRRIFKAVYGVTPQEYVTNKRLAQAAAIMSGGELHSIQQAALAVGYSDPLYFSRVFARRYGRCPTEYIRRLPE